VSINLSDLSRRKLTLDEYFALERTSDARLEYWQGEIVYLSGASRAHNLLCSNVYFRLRQQAITSDWIPFLAGVAVLTPLIPPYRYPDVVAVFGEPIFQNVSGVDALINPTLIVEVLSPATETRDREEKFFGYRAIPTFLEYLLVSQNQLLVTQYTKQPDGQWFRQDVSNIESTLSLGSVDCNLTVAEIYEGVDKLPKA
jgi:Uma2 family endonuclease